MSDDKGKVALIPVETKAREWLGKLLITTELLEKGFTVIVGPSQTLLANMMRFKPSIVLLHNADPDPVMEKQLRLIKSSGALVFLLENEGGVYSNYSQLAARLSPDITSYITEYFCWSKDVGEFLKENKTLRAPIKVTGHVNFDLLKNPYRTVYAVDAEKLKNSYRKLVLVNTNFTIFNGYIAGMYDHMFSRENINYVGVIMNHFFSLIQKLAIQMPSRDIVVRPHPSENQAPYHEAFCTLSNVFVISSGPVHPWLIAADALIHHNCTTALEATLANTPVITFRPVRDPNFDIEAANCCGVTAASADEVVHLLNNLERLAERQNVTNPPKFLENFEVDAHLAIAASIDERASSVDVTPIGAPLFFRWRSWLERLKPRMRKSKLLSLLMSDSQIKMIDYYDRKFPFTRLDETRGDFERVVRAKKMANRSFTVADLEGFPSAFIFSKNVVTDADPIESE